MTVDIITGPAFLASALVNGDTSGLSGDDQKVLEAFNRDHLGDYDVIDVARDEDGEAKEARFTWSYRLYGGDAGGGDVIDYVVIKREEAKKA